MMLLIMMRLLRSCIVMGIDGAVVVRGADDGGWRVICGGGQEEDGSGLWSRGVHSLLFLSFLSLSSSGINRPFHSAFAP